MISPSADLAYLWKVDGVSVSVVISRSVLSELRAGLGGQPAEAEFGGILVGSIESHGDGFRTRVDAFEPFPIEHRYGPNYGLSNRDRNLLERRLKRLRRHGVPVGFCRSHQRRGLYLDQRDFDLFKNDFRHPASVFLLVRSEDADGAKAAVFVWEEDDIRRHASYLEFPLDGPLAGPPVEDPLTGPVETPLTERAHVLPSELASPPKPDQRALPQLAVTRGDSFLAARAVEKPRAERAHVLPAKFATPSAPDQRALPQLAVTRGDSFLAGTAAEVLLSSGLARGRAAKLLLTVALPLLSFYAAREITVRRVRGAEVEHGRPVPEPIGLPSRQMDREVAPASEQPPQLLAAAPLPVSPTGQAVAPPPVQGRRTPASDSRDRSESGAKALVPVEGHVPRPDVTPERNIPLLPDPPAIAPHNSAPSLPRLTPFVPPPAPATGLPAGGVVAYVKPAPPSSIRHAFQKVPVILGLTAPKSGEGFVPANPVEQPLPSLPPKPVRLEKGTSVQLLAKVDRRGNVVNVKVVEGNHQLAGASSDALLRWRFEPARQNGEPVESGMLVRFEFHNLSR